LVSRFYFPLGTRRNQQVTNRLTMAFVLTFYSVSMCAGHVASGGF
jgi:hypothetical protein